MKHVLTLGLTLALASFQVLAAPSNAELNQKIKALKNRVADLEEKVANLENQQDPTNTDLLQLIQDQDTVIAELGEQLESITLSMPVEYEYVGVTPSSISYNLFDEAAEACRHEFGITAIIANTSQVLTAVMNGSYLTGNDAFARPTDVKPEASGSLFKYIDGAYGTPVDDSALVLINIRGYASTRQYTSAPIACSLPK